jgi:hypothetical protein
MRFGSGEAPGSRGERRRLGLRGHDEHGEREHEAHEHAGGKSFERESGEAAPPFRGQKRGRG